MRTIALRFIISEHSPPLHEGIGCVEALESHLPTLEKHVETFSGADISSDCLIDR